MQLTKLPLIGLIIGFVVVLIAIAVFIGVYIFVYKKAVKPAANKSGLTTAVNDLLATGEEAQAVILEVRETGLTVKEHSEIELLLEVRPEHGQPFRVRMTRAVYRFNVPLFQPGAKLKVKYDPEETSRVALISTPVPDTVIQKETGDRLEQLEQLRNKGLVTEEEYKRKRKEIMREL